MLERYTLEEESCVRESEKREKLEASTEMRKKTLQEECFGSAREEGGETEKNWKRTFFSLSLSQNFIKEKSREIERKLKRGIEIKLKEEKEETGKRKRKKGLPLTELDLEDCS